MQIKILHIYVTLKILDLCIFYQHIFFFQICFMCIMVVVKSITFFIIPSILLSELICTTGLTVPYFPQESGCPVQLAHTSTVELRGMRSSYSHSVQSQRNSPALRRYRSPFLLGSSLGKCSCSKDAQTASDGYIRQSPGTHWKAA